MSSYYGFSFRYVIGFYVYCFVVLSLELGV